MLSSVCSRAHTSLQSLSIDIDIEEKYKEMPEKCQDISKRNRKKCKRNANICRREIQRNVK